MTTATAGTPARPPPRPKGKRDYLSFSAVRTYQECPLKYFFRYVAGLPEETASASLVFGLAIYQAIEHHFRERAVPVGVAAHGDHQIKRHVGERAREL